MLSSVRSPLLVCRIAGVGENTVDRSHAEGGITPGAVPLRIEPLRDLFHPKRTRTLMPFGIEDEDQATKPERHFLNQAN